MSGFIFPLAQPWIGIAGSADRYPVRRVWCVGRNYLAHVRELGNDERELPFFFSKQPDMLVAGGGAIRYPSLTKNYHFEVELVVALKAGGENIHVADADALIFGHAVGLDMTRRDLQKQMQEKGRPWEIAKSFEQSAPIGALVPATGALPPARIRLSVNGAVKQEADTAQLIWSVPEIIVQLSRQVRLAAGDVIFTGTPEGVGPVVKGDRLEAEIEGLEPLAVTIA
ncbi:MAG TPA: fumarylacetoacetate hydrolase family protein [Rhizomicrobium sp.]|jgi:fumarylpyruvate hydrolase|nr:fumarylacetoacetate hydrolase family protein [Rhizomicrobium sp.]